MRTRTFGTASATTIACSSASTIHQTNYFTTRHGLVPHIDDAACGALAAHYAACLQDGKRVLDLMSSWVPHLPLNLALVTAIEHGVNGEELSANPRLDDYFIQNLKKNPQLLLGED